MVSGVSAVSGLTGVAKNRIRAMSKSNQYEMSIDGATAPKGPTLKVPGVSPLAVDNQGKWVALDRTANFLIQARPSVQLSKRSSISEEVTFVGELKAALLPWDPEEFADGAMNKFFSILMAPLYLACKITVPIVAEDYSGVLTGWTHLCSSLLRSAPVSIIMLKSARDREVVNH